jgi:hypothetical protein
MGARLVQQLVQHSPALLARVTRYVQQLRVVQFLSGFNIPWPPSAAAVQQNAPYVFLSVYLPKLLFDVWTITRRVPLDDELRKESDAELAAAIAKASSALHAFVEADWQVPEGTRAHVNKDLVARCIRMLLGKYGFEPPAPSTTCGCGDALAIAHGSEDDNSNGSEDGDGDGDGEGPSADSAARLFQMEEALAEALAKGDWTDEFDELHEKLTSVIMNWEVVRGT